MGLNADLTEGSSFRIGSSIIVRILVKVIPVAIACDDYNAEYFRKQHDGG